MSSCLRKTRTVLSIVKALISRGLFTLHGLICIWRVTVVKRNPIYWSLAGTLPLMILETIYTLCKKKDGEWKWICPSVLLYLGTAVPAIWFLEMDLMRQRLMIGFSRRHPVLAPNSSREILLLNGQIQFAISLGTEEWCKILEQMLLLVLIVGRWLLPKGEITREQLSQLLLVYIGMAADIIELFEAFKEKTVRENRLLTMIILSLWTGSLSQFTFVVTAAKSKKTRPVVFRSPSASASCGKGTKSCCPTEVLSILISVLLQDAPFLVLRMLLIFRYDVVSYTNIFFTSKNTLVLVLQIYRLFVLFSDKPKKPLETEASNCTTTGRTWSTSDSLSYYSESDCSLTGSDSNESGDSGHSLAQRYPKSKDQHNRRSLQTIDITVDDVDGTRSLERKSDSKRSPGRKHNKPNSVTISNHVIKRSNNNGRQDSDSSATKTPKTSPRLKENTNMVSPQKQQNKRKSRNEKDLADLNLADNRRNRKREKGRREWSEEEEAVSPSRRSHRMSPEVEKQVRKIEERNKASSPLPPPPPPLPNDLAYTGSDVTDDDVMDNHDVDVLKRSNSRRNEVRQTGKTSSKKDTLGPRHSNHHNNGRAAHDERHSPRAERKHHGEAKSKETTPASRRHNNSTHGSPSSSSSPRRQWRAVKDVRSALTFLDEKGIFRTVVLKPMGDGTSIYVVDKQYRDDRDNGQVVGTG